MISDIFLNSGVLEDLKALALWVSAGDFLAGFVARRLLGAPLVGFILCFRAQIFQNPFFKEGVLNHS